MREQVRCGQQLFDSLSTLTRPRPLPAFLKQVIQRLNDSCQIGEKFSVIIEKTKEDLSCWIILRLRAWSMALIFSGVARNPSASTL